MMFDKVQTKEKLLEELLEMLSGFSDSAEKSDEEGEEMEKAPMDKKIELMSIEKDPKAELSKEEAISGDDDGETLTGDNEKDLEILKRNKLKNLA